MTNLPGIFSTPLCNTFENEAKNIWDSLKTARGMGIIRDEETVTNNFLYNVQLAHPAEVATFQFHKPDEKFTGADWEWWLTDGSQWLGILIQAKILHPKSNKYSSIQHKVGKAKKPQIDILIEQANSKGIDALYFFYNYSKSGISAFQWNCGSTGPILEQLGCTVAHANSVKDVVGRGGAGLPTINPIAMPVRCLVGCPVYAGPNTSLPGKGYGVTRYLRGLTRGGDGREPDGGPTLRDEPPNYVRRLLSATLEDRSRIIDELRGEIGPIGSLIVMKETE